MIRSVCFGRQVATRLAPAFVLTLATLTASCEAGLGSAEEHVDFFGCAHTEVFASLSGPPAALSWRAYLCAQDHDGPGSGRIELFESPPARLLVEYEPGGILTVWEGDTSDATCDEGVGVRINRSDEGVGTAEGWISIQVRADEPMGCSVRVERE